MVSAVHECKLVIQYRTSSGPCLTLIRVLSRAVYEARDESRCKCIIRDTTRARFGNRTATSHDSGSKQITRDDSCGDIPTSYFSYRSCPRVSTRTRPTLSRCSVRDYACASTSPSRIFSTANHLSPTTRVPVRVVSYCTDHHGCCCCTAGSPGPKWPADM